MKGLQLALGTTGKEQVIRVHTSARNFQDRGLAMNEEIPKLKMKDGKDEGVRFNGKCKGYGLSKTSND